MIEDSTLDEEIANSMEATPEPEESEEPEITEAAQTDEDAESVPASNGSGTIKTDKTAGRADHRHVFG